MLYAYAIARAGLVTEGLTGLRDRHLETIEDAGLVAICSRHEDVELEATSVFAWAHERVIEALMERGDVLPMRFATTLGDEDAMRAQLRAGRQRFLEALDRVAGAVELGVRATRREPAPPARELEPALSGEGPGTAYMRTRLGTRRAADELRSDVHEALAARAREARLRRVTTGEQGAGVAGAYLVGRDDVAGFRAAADALEDELGGTTRILCTGPWPPYSFVDPEADR